MNAMTILREEKGLSIQQLAERTQFSPSHISAVESGTSVISIEMAVKCGEALGVHPADVIDWDQVLDLLER